MEIKGTEFFEYTKKTNHADGYFVFFGADWCGHCKNFKPIFVTMADEAVLQQRAVNPKMMFYDLTDSSDIMSTIFEINSYPTLIYIKGDKYWRYREKRDVESIFSWFENPQSEESGVYPEALPGWLEYSGIVLKGLGKEFKREYLYLQAHYPTSTIIGTGFCIFVLLMFFYVLYDCLADPARIRAEQAKLLAAKANEVPQPGTKEGPAESDKTGTSKDQDKKEK